MREEHVNRLERPNVVALSVAKVALSVRSKLLCAFLGITCLLLGLALFAMMALQQSNRRVEAMIHDQERIAYFNNIHTSFGEMNLMNLSLVIDQTPGDNSDEVFAFPAASFIGQIENLQIYIGQGTRRFVQPGSEDAKDIDAIRADLKNIKDKAAAMVRFRRQGRMEETADLGLDELFREIRSVQRDTHSLVRRVEQEMRDRASRTAEDQQSSRKMVAAAAATSIGLALLFGYAISSSLIWPVRRIGETLGVVARGNFEARVTVPNRDELGELAKNVNATSERLGNLYSKVETQRAELAAEHARSEALLYNLLPKDIAGRLKVEPERTIADSLPQVAILFADIVDFTPRASKLAPEDVVGFLNKIFSAFDQLANEHGLEKIKTIGDAYMVAAGIPSPCRDPVHRVAEMALDMQSTVAKLAQEFPEGLQVRIGLHTGPAVAGVIGNQKLFYDVWGETVNTASRMESHGDPGRIQVTTAAKEELDSDYIFVSRGTVDVKGVGEMETWWLTGKRVEPQRW